VNNEKKIMVNKFLLREGSVVLVIVLILIRQRYLSAIKNFFVFISIVSYISVNLPKFILNFSDILRVIES